MYVSNTHAHTRIWFWPGAPLLLQDFATPPAKMTLLSNITQHVKTQTHTHTCIYIYIYIYTHTHAYDYNRGLPCYFRIAQRHLQKMTLISIETQHMKTQTHTHAYIYTRTHMIPTWCSIATSGWSQPGALLLHQDCATPHPKMTYLSIDSKHMNTDTHTHMYIYIYIYTHTHTRIWFQPGAPLLLQDCGTPHPN